MDLLTIKKTHFFPNHTWMLRKRQSVDLQKIAFNGALTHKQKPTENLSKLFF